MMLEGLHGMLGTVARTCRAVWYGLLLMFDVLSISQRIRSWDGTFCIRGSGV